MVINTIRLETTGSLQERFRQFFQDLKEEVREETEEEKETREEKPEEETTEEKSEEETEKGAQPQKNNFRMLSALTPDVQIKDTGTREEAPPFLETRKEPVTYVPEKPP